ncbi:hypothetical protein K8I28_01205 [bacterium]|nr:hypothetical protein [bacterium]
MGVPLHFVISSNAMTRLLEKDEVAEEFYFLCKWNNYSLYLDEEGILEKSYKEKCEHWERFFGHSSFIKGLDFQIISLKREQEMSEEEFENLLAQKTVDKLLVVDSNQDLSWKKVSYLSLLKTKSIFFIASGIHKISKNQQVDKMLELLFHLIKRRHHEKIIIEDTHIHDRCNAFLECISNYLHGSTKIELKGLNKFREKIENSVLQLDGEIQDKIIINPVLSNKDIHPRFIIGSDFILKFDRSFHSINLSRKIVTHSGDYQFLSIEEY